MIRILSGSPEKVEGDALVRAVGQDLEGITPWSRRVGVRAGPEVADRLAATGSLPLGGAVVTSGGGLPVDFLIHVVLATAEEVVTEAGLARGLRNVLRQADHWEISSLVLPPLGTGAGNLDAETAARVTFRILKEHRSTFSFPRDVAIPTGTAYEEGAFRREMERSLPGGRLPSVPESPP